LLSKHALHDVQAGYQKGRGNSTRNLVDEDKVPIFNTTKSNRFVPGLSYGPSKP